MKPKEYNIKVHSISRVLIAMMIIFLSSVTLILDNLPRTENEIISIIQFLAVFLPSFYFAHLIGMAKVKILFTEEGIVHIWERRFVFSWTKNFKIPWSVVDNYVFQEDRTFDSFIINFTNKKRYKINRLNVIPIKDDFEKFITEFPKLSNEYKKGITSDTAARKIKKGESLYANKYFKWLLYLMSAIFLVIIITKVFDTNSKITWSSLGVISSGLIFYWLMIKGQKNN